MSDEFELLDYDETDDATQIEIKTREMNSNNNNETSIQNTSSINKIDF